MEGGREQDALPDGDDPTRAAVSLGAVRHPAEHLDLQQQIDTQRFKDNHIDPEWCRVEQVVNGQWTPRSEIIDPARSSL